MSRKRDRAALTLHVPAEASRIDRAFARDSAQLTLLLPEDAGRKALARVVESWRPEAASTLVQSIGEFVGYEEVGETLGDRVEVLQSVRALRIRGEGSLGEVFASWVAETLVVLHGSEDDVRVLNDAIVRERRRWWCLASGDERSVYIRHAAAGGLVVFYSRDHSSIEAFGARDLILTLFDHAREVLDWPNVPTPIL